MQEEIEGLVAESLGPLTAAGHTPVVLASPAVRGVVHQILEPHIPGVAVLGYNEVVQGVEVESMGYVQWPESKPKAPSREAVGAA